MKTGTASQNERSGDVPAPQFRQDLSGWKLRVDRVAADDYTRSGAWPGRTVWQAASAYAQRSPDRTLVIDGLVSWTVAGILATAREIAGGLHALGLRPGDVVSYQLPNWWESMAINLAAGFAGLVCNPIAPILRERELRFMLADARTRVVFVPSVFRGFDYLAMLAGLRAELPELACVVSLRAGPIEGVIEFDMLRERGRGHRWAPPEVDPNAVKLLLHTSGTTGKPQGVLHTHNTLMSELGAVMRNWRVGADDVVIMPSPVGHVTGYLYGLELPIVAGASVVLMERWDAAAAAALIAQHRATMTIAATPFLNELAQQATQHRGLPSLRIFASGGAPVPPEVVARARGAFSNCQVFRVYGSTEAPTVTLGLVQGDDPALGATTDGRIANTEVRIGGADGLAAQEGELAVRGPEVMLGYTNWEDTLQAFDSEGFFRTGDLASLSSDGFLTISGRKKDLIIRGGENISAKEIEDVLHADASISEAAVVAMPHARLGEGVCAFVVPAPGEATDLARVSAIMQAAGLARQKHPERVEVVRELPRTASGKVRKNLLRDRIRTLVEGGAGAAQ